MGLHASSIKNQDEQNISTLSTCLTATSVRRTLSVNAIQEAPNEYRNIFHMNSLRKKIINSTKALGSGASSKHKNSSRKINLLEHARLLRDLTDSWNVMEIDKLVDGYRAALTLSELSKLADDARPYRASLSRDIYQLLKNSCCCDIQIKCDGVTFAAHKVLLAARSGYFKNLIDNRSTLLSGSVILINNSSLNHKLFFVLLEYIYLGKLLDERDISGAQCLSGLINEVALEFGVRNSLESDLRQLMDNGLYYDALLILQSTDHRNTQLLSSDYCSRAPEYEFPCHVFILASRSVFFQKYFSKQKSDSKVCSKRPEPRRSHNTSMQCIEIDERVIPRRFVRAILHTLYTDELDFTLVLPKVHGSIIGATSSGTTTLSEVKAMMLGQMVARPVRQQIQFSPKLVDAMELYQIGRFLNFQQIIQGCEDMIVSECPVSSLPSLLNWCSVDGQGSDWVRRRVMQMLYSRFGDLSSNDEFLGTLTKQHMIELVASDYLQMSELDILLVIIRWGELQLLKWFIDSDNTVARANTRPTDSIVRATSFVPLGRFSRHRKSRVIPKRRSISTPIDATTETAELAELISELLVYVRCGHILAPNVVESVGGKSERMRIQYRGLAIARKLGLFNSRETVDSINSLVWNLKKNLSLDFLHLSNRSSDWIPSESHRNSDFLRPRLFLPFYNQSRLILKERLERLKKNESSQSVPCVMGVISRYDTFNKIADKKQGKDVGKTCKNSEHKSIELILNNDFYNDDSNQDLFDRLKKKKVPTATLR